MEHYTFYPKNVCSTKIELDVDSGTIHNLHYTNGCNGNLKAIGRLVEGMSVKEAITRLDGICCGDSATSCSDQLAQNLKTIV